ncbi:hypothetical protein ACVC7V_25550 [Hydrogenophaga sp. A37]|uniref:hypothetical protein n=1 Tax=Hydrogenophaga sp. A37 TaxID=1945864 RepID=UPI000987C829|nr:hypothetical protein [Hydrogenophaga sp. A37]OOG89233.1 hypothetical protein B0E41_00690 [Hydrogenophaga sp. A37]
MPLKPEVPGSKGFPVLNMLKRFDTGHGACFAQHLQLVALLFALPACSSRSDWRTKMNRGISPVPPEGLMEPLDIDLESLDHALMDLLTSDWQTLEDDGEPLDAAEVAPRLSPTA